MGWMSYTPQDFARELLDELAKGYNIQRLSTWAMATYIKRCPESSDELIQEMLSIVVMEEGPGFELSEEEIIEFAHRLSGLPQDR